jgi:hypothetical protein
LRRSTNTDAHEASLRTLVPTDSYAASDLIKRSSHRKLAKFLASLEKASLLALKKPSRAGGADDVLVTSLSHGVALLEDHVHFWTVAEHEEKEARRRARELVEDGSVAGSGSGSGGGPGTPPLDVRELWKFSGKNEAFNALLDARAHRGKEKEATREGYFTTHELRSLLDAYIAQHALVHPVERRYVVLDDVLRALLLEPRKKTKKNKTEEKEEKEDEAEVEFLPREELVPRLKEGSGVQAWYEIRRGKDVSFKCVHFFFFHDFGAYYSGGLHPS